MCGHDTEPLKESIEKINESEGVLIALAIKQQAEFFVSNLEEEQRAEMAPSKVEQYMARFIKNLPLGCQYSWNPVDLFLSDHERLCMALDVCGQDVGRMRNLINDIRDYKAELIELTLKQQAKFTGREDDSNQEKKGDEHTKHNLKIHNVPQSPDKSIAFVHKDHPAVENNGQPAVDGVWIRVPRDQFETRCDSIVSLNTSLSTSF